MDPELVRVTEELVRTTQGLVVATYVLGGVAILQFFAMVVHAFHFGHMKELAVAATKAAEAASKSAGTAEEGLKISKRAYLSVNDLQIVLTQPEGRHTFTGVFTLVNIGETRAHSIRVTTYMEARDSVPDIPPEGEAINQRQYQILPGQSAEIGSASIQVNDGMLESVKSGTCVVLLCGRIDYRDVFGMEQFTMFGFNYPSGTITDEPYNKAT